MNVNADIKTSGSTDSLRHLGKLGLEVKRPQRPLQEEGLTRDELFNLVRARLERVPVQILSRTGALHLKGAPTLFLELSLFEWQPGSYLYTVTLELVQGVRLERLMESSERFFAAPTWGAQAVGLVQQRQLSFLKEQIGVTADAFVKDSAVRR